MMFHLKVANLNRRKEKKEKHDHQNTVDNTISKEIETQNKEIP
jgi:hypothetical protein